MRKVIVAALAACALGLGTAPAAHAAGATYDGPGCGFDALNGWGAMYGAVVAYSTVETENPVSVRLTCVLKVEGQPYYTETYSGLGFAVGARQIEFPWWATDLVMCETVEFLNTGDAPVSRCDEASDVIDDLWNLLTEIEVEYVDPLVCPVLAALSPGVPGTLDIDPEGDIYVLGQPQWDCPPYDVIWD
jgi:hypothetical protein